MANIKVAVLNGSTVVTDDKEVQRVLGALQKQVQQHWAPIWGSDADLIFVPRGQKPPDGAWWLAILDDSDQAGALGYHDVTTEGLPLGKVFAKTDKTYGLLWSVTASHELLEMLGDPDINLTAFVQGASGGTLYAYEVCDACEADELAYDIDGVKVSDFVYPAWFESFRAEGQGPFDRQNRIEKPFQLLPGGYIGVYDVTRGSGWTQLTAKLAGQPAMARVATHAARIRPKVGSRRERRRTLRNQWQPSMADCWKGTPLPR
jgi:hypothetical protein